MKSVMLSTIDNPFDPFVDFDNWYKFDEEKGYHTCSYLARIANLSDDCSEMENEESLEEAIDEAVSLNVLGIYKKVVSNNDSDRGEGS